MKLMVEIQLDWLSEDGRVDEIVKDEIIGRVIGSIDKEVMKTVKEDAAKTASRQVTARINDMLDGFLNGEPIVITDNYGDKKAQYENVREMIKERFDKFMTMSVDQNGKPSTTCNRYGEKIYTNLEFLLDSIIKERFEKASKEIIADTEYKIREAINKTVKSTISDVLLEKIDLAGSIVGKPTK